jgi:peptide deformylase
MELKIIDSAEATKPKIEIPAGFGLVIEDNTKLNSVLPKYEFESETQEERTKFASLMLSAVEAFNGLGLSANQMGSNKRMFVMRLLDEAAYLKGEFSFKENLVLFNPKVAFYGVEEKAEREGCLSYPGLMLQIKRKTFVEAQYQDEFGEVKTAVFNNINARCFLHELDHMNGVIFTKQVKPAFLALARQKQKKLINRYKKAA